MADIDVLFGTNAPEVAREIGAAEKATQQAAQATSALDQMVQKLSGHLRSEVGDLKKAAGAAREYARSLRDTQDSVTGGSTRGRFGHGNSGFLGTAYGSMPGELAKARTNIFQALMKTNRELREVANLGGEEAGKAWVKRLGAVFSRLGTAGGGIGARLAGGLGLGGGLGAAALGFVAIERAASIANFALDNTIQKLDRAAQGALNFARASRTARDLNGAAGLSTARAQGGAITQLVGSGGQAALDQANTLSRSGFTFADASAAVLSARNRFGDNADAALSIAARAARAGGTTVAENVNGLGGDELSNPGLAAARLLAVSRNQSGYSEGELQATEARLGGNGLTTSIASINGALGSRDVNAQGLIPNGVGAAMGAAADAKDPGGKYLLNLYTSSQEEVGVLRQINANMGGWAKVWDWITHPGNTRAQQLDKAEDAVVLNAGGH